MNMSRITALALVAALATPALAQSPAPAPKKTTTATTAPATVGTVKPPQGTGRSYGNRTPDPKSPNFFTDLMDSRTKWN